MSLTCLKFCKRSAVKLLDIQRALHKPWKMLSIDSTMPLLYLHSARQALLWAHQARPTSWNVEAMICQDSFVQSLKNGKGRDVVMYPMKKYEKMLSQSHLLLELPTNRRSPTWWIGLAKQLTYSSLMAVHILQPCFGGELVVAAIHLPDLVLGQSAL